MPQLVLSLVVVKNLFFSCRVAFLWKLELEKVFLIFLVSSLFCSRILWNLLYYLFHKTLLMRCCKQLLVRSYHLPTDIFNNSIVCSFNIAKKQLHQYTKKASRLSSPLRKTEVKTNKRDACNSRQLVHAPATTTICITQERRWATWRERLNVFLFLLFLGCFWLIYVCPKKPFIVSYYLLCRVPARFHA